MATLPRPYLGGLSTRLYSPSGPSPPSEAPSRTLLKPNPKPNPNPNWRLLREPCSKLTLNLTLTLIGGSFENLAQSHQLVQGLVAPLLAAGRLEDATEVLVTSTHLGVPLGDVGTMSALLDISESLMESGTPLVAINMIDRAELGSFASSEVLTGVANHFLKHFLNNGRIRDVRTVALMMQRKGISGDDETA